MSYMLLILEKGEDRRNRPLEGGRAAYSSMLRFADDLNSRGLLKACDALRSDALGTRLSRQGGKSTVVDGPFTESKEIVGGFFLVDCKTKAEALALAEECPAIAWATVEVREVGTCFEDLG
jgi:hypothetical protein